MGCDYLTTDSVLMMGRFLCSMERINYMNNQQRIHDDLLTTLTTMGGVSTFAAELIAQYLLTKYKMEDYNGR